MADKSLNRDTSKLDPTTWPSPTDRRKVLASKLEKLSSPG